VIVGVVKIEGHEDYSKLWDVIPDDFLSTDLVDSMGKSFSPLIRTVLIEYPLWTKITGAPITASIRKDIENTTNFAFDCIFSNKTSLAWRT